MLHLPSFLIWTFWFCQTSPNFKDVLFVDQKIVERWGSSLKDATKPLTREAQLLSQNLLQTSKFLFYDSSIFYDFYDNLILVTIAISDWLFHPILVC
jgi:hypothetical protein